jgi:hypothetical protein
MALNAYADREKIPRNRRGISLTTPILAKQQDQKDERDRDSDKPEKNGHGCFPFGLKLAG